MRGNARKTVGAIKRLVNFRFDHGMAFFEVERIIKSEVPDENHQNGQELAQVKIEIADVIIEVPDDSVVDDHAPECIMKIEYSRAIPDFDYGRSRGD